jgi:predicted transcriptional regulator
MKLLRRGVDLDRGRAVNVLQHVQVSEVMRPDVVTAAPDDHLLALISKFIDHPGSTLFVVDEEGMLEGIVKVDQIRPIMKDPASLETLIIAEDVMVAAEFPKVSATDSLADVMRMLVAYRGEVPVLENGRLAGVIWPEDVIARYNTEIFKRDMAGGMASAVGQEAGVESIQAAHDTVVAEIPAPGPFVGRTIRELNIRQDFGASVLMVKRTTGTGDEALDTAPDPDYAFQYGDVMLVLAPSDQLRCLRRGVPRSK